MFDGWDLHDVPGSSCEHVYLGGICMIYLFHTCLPYLDVNGLGLSTGLLGWGLCDLNALHKSAKRDI